MRATRGRARTWGAGAAILAAWGALACVPARGGWSVDALEARHPALGASRHRLRDLAPHFVPAGGQLVLFLCRWPDAAPIPVALPEDARPDEAEMLRLALRAWTQSDLGVRFVETAGETSGAGIAIRFVSVGDRVPVPAGAGDTIADCRVDAAAEPPGDRVAARLVSASIHLRRDQTDLVGRAVPLGADERLGAAVHEIGHALGFSSHVAAGSSVMRPSPEIARRVGAAVRAGTWSGDASVAALYAVPSGVVVGVRPLGADAARQLTRLADAARTAGLAGPYTRVGDRSARLAYRPPQRGPAAALRAMPWPLGRRGPALSLVPNRAARALLATDPR
jgi:hypothetical protein